jgi:hypothetical protein
MATYKFNLQNAANGWDEGNLSMKDAASSVLFGLIFDPEDAGDIFPCNVG